MLPFKRLVAEYLDKKKHAAYPYRYLVLSGNYIVTAWSYKHFVKISYFRFQIVNCFGFCRYIVFFNVVYVYMHTNNYEFIETKTTYSLKWREPFTCACLIGTSALRAYALSLWPHVSSTGKTNENKQQADFRSAKFRLASK
jgi:hypothetical protein